MQGHEPGTQSLESGMNAALGSTGEIWDERTAAAYAAENAPMFADDAIGPAVERLAALAAGGAALEFAVGTGRIALPLLRRGVPVSGIDSSAAMLAELRKQVDEKTLPAQVGDMALDSVSGRFSLVYLVYNTISNLLTADAQRACFRNAARHLTPGGRFVIELWVPALPPAPPAPQAVVIHSSADYLLVDQYDVDAQHVVSNHLRIEGTGATHVVRSRHRYIFPAELDSMAAEAGFVCEARHADWAGTPFTPASEKHVTIYRLA